MTAYIWAAAHDHALAAVAATANAVVGLAVLTGAVLGAEVNDGLLVGALLFIMGTGVSIAGWGLILLVRLSQVVSKLEATAEDHDGRLSRLER